MKKKQAIVNKALKKYLLSVKASSPAGLYRAMEYSVMAGGKRIRPVLMLLIADVLGKPAGKVLPAACAAELIHTSTLILDDLPCMDDSALRRGRATCHVRFSDSTAILASYGLVMLAFELIRDERSAVSLSRAVGARGVAAGEFEDLRVGSKKAGVEVIKDIHLKKTAALFISACEMAGIILGVRGRRLAALKKYGRNLGLAFQLQDDILSLTRTDEQLGKQTKQDACAPNLARAIGAKKAKELLRRYIREGKNALKPFGARAHSLEKLIEFSTERKK